LYDTDRDFMTDWSVVCLLLQSKLHRSWTTLSQC